MGRDRQPKIESMLQECRLDLVRCMEDGSCELSHSDSPTPHLSTFSESLQPIFPQLMAFSGGSN